MNQKEIAGFLDQLLARIESGQCSANYAITIAFMRGLEEGQKKYLSNAPPDDARIVGVAVEKDGDLQFGLARYQNKIWMHWARNEPLGAVPKHWTEVA